MQVSVYMLEAYYNEDSLFPRRRMRERERGILSSFSSSILEAICAGSGASPAFAAPRPALFVLLFLSAPPGDGALLMLLSLVYIDTPSISQGYSLLFLSSSQPTILGDDDVDTVFFLSFFSFYMFG